MKLLRCAVILGAVALNNSPSLSEDIWAEWPSFEAADSAPAEIILQLKNVWHLDCGDGSEELVGRITDAASGLNKYVLLLDSQLYHVLVVSPAGNIEQVLGQKGEGPGDWPGAYRVLQLPDGRIGVGDGVQPFTFKFGGTGNIVFLDQDGLPAGVWNGVSDRTAKPMCSIRELRSSSGHVLVASQGTTFGKSGVVSVEELAIFDPGDGQSVVVSRRESVDDMSSQVISELEGFEPFSHGRCDISNLGRVAFAPYRDKWFVVIRESDGTGFSISRELEPIKRTEAAKSTMRKKLGCTDDTDVCSVLDTEHLVGRIRWRPDGNLWVEPFGVKPTQGAVACFDEFGPDGDFLRRVQVAVPVTRPGDELLVLADGRFLVLSGFDESEEDGRGVEADAQVSLYVLE